MGALLSLLLIVLGIAVLAFGADTLVRGAVTLARVARVPAAVIGLTIVSMGTSLPELTVSVTASLRGAADLGVGNVVGSNIFNIGVVLGLSALVLPMRIHGSAARFEMPFMFLASFQLLLLARDGQLDRLEGAFFIVAVILFTAYVVRIGRSDLQHEEAADLAWEVQRRAPRSHLRTLGGALALVAAGTAILIVGGEVLLRGAVGLARAAGMTERVIGLTIVAIGTGTPEVATSIVAARRGQSEIALGNVIGSNIYNILGVLGVTAFVAPIAISPAVIRSDLWWMLGLSVALFPILRRGEVVTRREGAVLLAGYATYLTLLAFGL